MNSESLYLQHLDVIEGVIGAICRRNRLAGAEADDFRSLARVKLLDRDCEVLRRFGGRSALRTYLTVVLQRAYLDYRVSLWGKWRPSAQAKRQGPIAIRLEQLTARDGLTLGEASEMLRTTHGVTLTDAEFERIAAKIPTRVSRRMAGEEELAVVADGGPGPETMAEHAELLPHAQRAREALQRAVAALDPEERLIVRLHFEQDRGVVEIARVLSADPKPLYRRLEKVLGRLRGALEAEDIDMQSVAELLPVGWSDLVEGRAVPGEGANAVARPSI